MIFAITLCDFKLDACIEFFKVRRVYFYFDRVGFVLETIFYLTFLIMVGIYLQVSDSFFGNRVRFQYFNLVFNTITIAHQTQGATAVEQHVAITATFLTIVVFDEQLSACLIYRSRITKVNCC